MARAIRHLRPAPGDVRHFISRKPTTPTESFSALCRESLLATSRGLSIDPLETNNQDSRHKAENDSAHVAATRSSSPPPNGGGAARTSSATSGLRWGTALTPRTVRARGHTVPHLTCARCAHLARGSSPARGRTKLSARLTSETRPHPNPAAPRQGSRPRVRNPAGSRSSRTTRAPASSSAGWSCRCIAPPLPDRRTSNG